MIIPNPAVDIAPHIKVQVLNESSVMVLIAQEHQDINAIMRNQMVQNIMHLLMQTKPNWLRDCVAAYDKLLIEFNPMRVNHYDVIERLYKLLSQNKTSLNILNNSALNNDELGKIHNIPVCYDHINDEYPHDIEILQRENQLTRDEIIALHVQRPYRVFAVGFMPNFAYLGELPQALNIPRLSKPRQKVPAGAVAIADNQTAVYPSTSPGGWHIIGYTPLNLLHDTHINFTVGDRVSFNAIAKEAFLESMEMQS